MTSVTGVVLTYTPMPLMDEWALVTFWQRFEQNGLLWRDLFFQHNEHRILFARLFSLADYAWFQGRDILSLVLIALTQLCAALLFWIAARQARPGLLAFLTAALSMAMIFSLAQYENFFWGFQVQFVGVFAAGAWSIYAAVKADTADRRAWLWWTLALVSLVYASFNMANGLFAGFAATLAALVSGRRWRLVAAPAVATLLLLALYMHDYIPVAHHSAASEALRHPLRYLLFLSAYLGGPWGLHGPLEAVIVGALGIMATIAMTLRALRRRGELGVAEIAMIGIVFFVGMSAGVTALGRLNFGVAHAQSVRYFTGSFYFWAAQATFWAIAAREWKPVWRVGLGGLMVCACLMLIPLQLKGDSELRRIKVEMLAGQSAVLGQVFSQDTLRHINPQGEMVLILGEYLKARRLAIFATPQPETGPLSRFVIADPSLCRGAFDVIFPESYGHKRAFGWGWELSAHRPMSRILVADRTGQVLGIGVSGTDRPDVDQALAEVTHIRVGWVAILPPHEPGELTAYGLLTDGRACELGRRPTP